MMINSLGEASRMELKNADIVANKSPIQIGSLSNFVEHEDNKKDGNIIVTKMKKSVEIMAKPRTALFQGSENDEPMTIQNIHAENSVIGSNMETCISYVSPIQLVLLYVMANIGRRMIYLQLPGCYQRYILEMQHCLREKIICHQGDIFIQALRWRR